MGVRGPTVASKEIVVTLCYLSAQLSTDGEGFLQLSKGTVVPPSLPVTCVLLGYTYFGHEAVLDPLR